MAFSLDNGEKELRGTRQFQSVISPSFYISNQNGRCTQENKSRIRSPCARETVYKLSLSVAYNRSLDVCCKRERDQSNTNVTNISNLSAHKIWPKFFQS